MLPSNPLRKPAKSSWDNVWVALSLLSSFALALGLFQLLPYFTASQIVGGTKTAPADPILFNLTAGGVRLSLLLAYMWGISHLKDIGRASYVGITDQEALDGFTLLARSEGIIPAFESAHAIAYALKLAGEREDDPVVLVSLSGRGDKDMASAQKLLAG